MSFETLGLAPALLSAVQKAGFTEPTAVQASAIPKALAGKDLMVSSQTGSGKTAAFMLPALNRISHMPAGKGAGVQVLVLTPTRELAMQISAATQSYGAHLKDLRIATVVGGMPYGAQLKALSRRVDVLVATPGRLIDHLHSKRVNLSAVHTLVLDEADRMLDMGFIEDIETIVGRTPDSRQTLLFSATLDGTIARLAGKMMRDAITIEVSGHKKQHTNITQNLLYADDNSHKMRLLDHLLRDTNLDQAIVFTATKRGADDLANRLADQGFSAAALHGDMNQRQRTRTLGLLQRHQLRILVATDVAARGIDVQGITHAINYDLPMQPEDYTHRIGRTGRAGHSGLAYTLAVHSERHKVRRIEHFIGQSIPAQIIEGLEPKKTVRPTYTDRKPAGDRSFGAKGRSSFGGGKPGYGGKPSYGGKSTYGDKPAFGGRPSHGDKPAYQGRPVNSEDRPAYSARPATDHRPAYEGRPARASEAPRGYAGRSEAGSRSHGGAEKRAERPDYANRSTLSTRPAHDKAAGSARGDFAPKRPSRPTGHTSTRARAAAPRTGYAGKASPRHDKGSAHRPDIA